MMNDSSKKFYHSFLFLSVFQNPSLSSTQDSVSKLQKLVARGTTMRLENTWLDKRKSPLFLEYKWSTKE